MRVASRQLPNDEGAGGTNRAPDGQLPRAGRLVARARERGLKRSHDLRDIDPGERRARDARQDGREGEDHLRHAAGDPFVELVELRPAELVTGRGLVVAQREQPIAQANKGLHPSA